MNKTKTRKSRKWPYIIILYGLLLISSNLFFSESDIAVPDFTISESDSTIVVIFNDPILNTDTKSEINVSSGVGIIYLINLNQYKSFDLDSLGSLYPESNMHIVGVGAGASEAILQTSESESKVTSLSLIAPAGIPELEWLGGATLNNLLYNSGSSFFSFLDVCLPHFGFIETLNQRAEHFSILAESKSSVNRQRIQNLNLPVSIHYYSWSANPVSVAQEFSRITPHSEFQNYEGDSFNWRQNLAFFESAESGKALTKSVADSARLTESALAFDPADSLKKEGRSLALLILLIILSTLITEDLTCIGTGLMIARGMIGFVPGVAACLFGIFFGDILLYLAGRWLASSTLHKAPLKWFIDEKDIERSYFWFEAKGPAIIIMSRFIPGSRMPTYFSAGAIGASFWMFILYFGIASILWTPILVGLAVWLGQNMISYFTLYQEYALLVLLGVLSILFVVFKILIPSFTFKGRRLLIGKWRRLINWEFWSPFIVYIPVLLYTFFLWMKYKKPGLVALANPGIEYGGFINESKSSILNRIGMHNHVARFKAVLNFDNPQKNLELIYQFMEEENLTFPIVLKPDIGQRGKGVFIAKNDDELAESILNEKNDFIAQEYIPGIEFGVFYYRLPNETQGRILSLTQKHYKSLQGDGEHTIEELILNDDRAVCQAEIHFDFHIDSLFEIPEKGEEIPLVEIGTHARGSLFTDANHLITDALTSKIDEISKSYNGFYFGRYDIKVPELDSLIRGEDIKILELNGVTSEAAHIYDPRHNFLFGVKTLIHQWRIAYEIGYQVKMKNPEIRVPGLREMLSLLN